jgi:hypothetical protein
MRSLLQAIERFLQEANKIQMSWIFEPGWLLAIHCLTEIAMKKDVLHIKLMNRPAASNAFLNAKR